MKQSAWVAGLGLVFACGCAREPEKLVPVSGRVTLDGQPLAGAYVSFHPRGSADNSTPGPASFGKTDQNGHYSLAPVLPANVSGYVGVGAVTGPHRVVIRKAANESPGTAEESGQYKDLLPARYNAQSELEFTVPAGGTDKADFKLTSEPEDGPGPSESQKGKP